MAVSKNDPELLAAINDAMQKMTDSGEMKALNDKWF